ncbi:hypothetical protein JCM10449v2_005622 [Rhodotorula kratochvilovae]
MRARSCRFRALPFVRKGKGKQIFFVSSMVASFGASTPRPPLACMYVVALRSHSMSKAALNMYGLKLARELGPEGFTCTLFHPGYVQTDMNKFDNGGNITTKEAVSLATKNVFLPAVPSWNGRFMDYEGKDMAW